jgi:hypothetical protein
LIKPLKCAALRSSAPAAQVAATNKSSENLPTLELIILLFMRDLLFADEIAAPTRWNTSTLP